MSETTTIMMRSMMLRIKKKRNPTMSRSNPELKLMVKDIQLVRAMLKTANEHGYRHEKNKGSRTWSVNARIDNLQDVVRNYRKEMADRRDDPLQSEGKLSAEVQREIRWQFRELTRRRKFNLNVEVGKKGMAGTCKYESAKYGKPDLTLYVGHLWYRRVYKNLIVNQCFTNADDYLILAATEYRVNVPSIRLWQASVYSFKEKTTRPGWIGQSNLGSKLCAFRADRDMAIKMAKELAAREINQKLGETSNV